MGHGGKEIIPKKRSKYSLVLQLGRFKRASTKRIFIRLQPHGGTAQPKRSSRGNLRGGSRLGGRLRVGSRRRWSTLLTQGGTPERWRACSLGHFGLRNALADFHRWFDHNRCCCCCSRGRTHRTSWRTAVRLSTPVNSKQKITLEPLSLYQKPFKSLT